MRLLSNELDYADCLVAVPRTVPPAPFLKWAGGKSALLPDLRRFSPRQFDRYVEPFLGGGAMLFDLTPRRFLAADANLELIHCYQMVRDRVDDLLICLSGIKVDEAEFYRWREKSPENLDPVERAARSIYLNRTCFNGLWRVNRHGRFNTPYGHPRTTKLVDPDRLRAVGRFLAQGELRHSDFRDLLNEARAGDFVYLDPPYVPVGKNADFKRYTRDQFRAEDQRQLAELYRTLDDRGCLLLLSNADHPEVRRLYHGFQIHEVRAPRMINCRGDRRGEIGELLVANYR